MKKKNKFYEVKNIHDHPFIQAIWCKELNGYIRKMSVLGSYMTENKRQQKVINRLSRKIQRLKGISFKDKEITLLLYCIDLVIQNFGDNQELEKIYARLYRQRKESMDREKKGF